MVKVRRCGNFEGKTADPHTAMVVYSVEQKHCDQSGTEVYKILILKAKFKFS